MHAYCQLQPLRQPDLTAGYRYVIRHPILRTFVYHAVVGTVWQQENASTTQSLERWAIYLLNECSLIDSAKARDITGSISQICMHGLLAQTYYQWAPSPQIRASHPTHIPGVIISHAHLAPALIVFHLHRAQLT